MTNTPHITFAFLEQLLSLINNRNVDITDTLVKIYQRSRSVFGRISRRDRGAISGAMRAIAPRSLSSIA